VQLIAGANQLVNGLISTRLQPGAEAPRMGNRFNGFFFPSTMKPLKRLVCLPRTQHPAEAGC
jgi:hypothetical protein